MKVDKKILIKGAMMLPLAGLLMGNQSCEQKPQTGRQLRKIVEFGKISSPAIRLPDGSAFDFQFVANQQAYGVLMASEGFALRYAPPVVSASASGIEFNRMSVGDQQLMSKLGKIDGNGIVNWSTTASCMVNMPAARIYGSVNSFEMIGGGGLTVGFTPAGSSTITSAALGFQLEFAQMDLSMQAVRPLTNTLMSAVNVNTKQTKTKVNLAISFGMFSLGPNFYYSTPLANVTKNGLTTAVTALKADLDKSEEWSTRVLANHDSHLTIIGGTNVNLEVGDQLNVYNEMYYWDGEPCNSTYRGGAATAPVAVIQIESVGDEISIGKVISQTDENAVIGAKVKLKQLHEVADAVAAVAKK